MSPAKLLAATVLAVCSSSLFAQSGSFGAGFAGYSEPGGGATTSLIQASDGNFYGASDNAIYRYASAVVTGQTISGSGTTSPILHSVGGGTDLGQYSALIQGTDGALYGTSPVGGANGAGQVFRVDLAGNFSTLYSFCALASCADGASPTASLITGTDGNLYGITSFGSADDSGTSVIAPGTIFRLTPEGTLTTLYTAGCASGTICTAKDYLISPLVQASDGNFYGIATGNGGAELYQLTSSGAFRLLQALCQSYCVVGAAQQASLVQGADGKLYGYVGDGDINPTSTAFTFDSSGTYTQLFTYCYDPGSSTACTGNIDFAQPTGPIFLAGDGNIYGTAQIGGSNGYGAVYNLQNGLIYSFSSQGGSAPTNGVIEDQYGTLYGYAENGGEGYGGQYTLSFSNGEGQPTITPAIQMSPTNLNLLTGQPATFTWKVNNAASLTMQQCIGRVNNQTVSAAPVTGTYTYTPSGAGSYRVALTCGGIETAYSDVIVTATQTPTFTGLEFLLGLDGYYTADIDVNKLNGVPGLPTGTVSLLLNNTAVVTAPLSSPGLMGLNGTLTTLPSGSYTVTARYNGDAGDLPSTSAPTTLAVNDETAGVLSAVVGIEAKTGSAEGHVDFGLANLESNTAPTGTVTFSYAGKTLATVAVTNSGASTGRFTGLPAGTYLVTANYSGDANNAPLTASLSVVVP